MVVTTEIHRPPSKVGAAIHHRRKKQRPAQILQAAFHSFAGNGFSACRMADIAAAAGVSKGTVYLYFDSKVDLFKAVVREIIEPALAFERVEKTIAEDRGPSVLLLRRLLASWVKALSAPAMRPLLRILACDARTVPEIAPFCHERITVRAEQLIERVIAKGIRGNQFCVLDEHLAARALIAPFYLFVLWPVDRDRMCRGDNDLLGAIRTCIELQINGLLLRP